MTSKSQRRRRTWPKPDYRLATLTPQAQTVLKHLRGAGSITQREAMLDHSIPSLPRRIKDLREAGYDVVGVWKTHPLTGQRYTRYSLNEG